MLIWLERGGIWSGGKQTRAECIRWIPHSDHCGLPPKGLDGKEWLRLCVWQPQVCEHPNIDENEIDLTFSHGDQNERDLFAIVLFWILTRDTLFNMPQQQQTSLFQSTRVAYSDHSSNPVCGFFMMEQVRLCTVWPQENWLGTSKTTCRVGWMIWICYSRALERRCLCNK